MRYHISLSPLSESSIAWDPEYSSPFVEYGDQLCQDRSHILVVSSAQKFGKYDKEKASYLYWESGGAIVQTRLSSAMGKTTKHILHERMHSTWRSVLKLCI
jgi:hypothetical protein